MWNVFLLPITLRILLSCKFVFKYLSRLKDKRPNVYLKTLELWILKPMLDLHFLLISRSKSSLVCVLKSV